MSSFSSVGTMYLPGDRGVYRWAVAPKLAALTVVLIIVATMRTLPVLVAASALLLLASLSSGLPLRHVLATAWWMRWFILIIAGLQWWLNGWESAVTNTGSMVLAVLWASLLTLTTKTSDLLDALQQAATPLATAWRRLTGRIIRPQNVGLTLSLTLTSIPVLQRLIDEVLAARAARGLSRSSRALAVPAMIRTLRHADALGEALAARGFDDD